MPGDAGMIEEATGDLDGDGEEDRAISYETASTGTVLRVELQTGGVIEATLDAGFGEKVGLLGLHDLDRDGDDEVFTAAGQGAAAELVGLFDLSGCDLAPITQGGAPVIFGLSFSAAAVSGLSCKDDYIDDLYYTTLESSDGKTYEGRIAAYNLIDGELVESDSEGAAYPRDDLGAVAGLHCGDLSFS